MTLRMKDFLTPTWALIVIGVLVGGTVAIMEMFVGHYFATNQVMVWTLPLITYIFLALMSTGISIVVAYGLITDNAVIKEHLRPLLIMAIGILLGGFAALATELGSLLNMVWILLTPNPTSPIWWMGTLYSIELVLLFVKLAIDLTGKHTVIDRPLAWGTIVVAAAATMTIGAVFGTVTARPDYAGAFLSVVTLTAAIVSGMAAVALFRPASAMTEMAAKVLRFSALAFAGLLVARLAYEAKETTLGMVGWSDPLMLIPFVAIVLLAGLPYVTRPLALLVLAGVLWVEYSFIIAGQLKPQGPLATWYGDLTSYTPNLWEVGTFVLGVSLAAFIVKLGWQVLVHREPVEEIRPVEGELAAAE
jgi:hypothetical protein